MPQPNLTTHNSFGVVVPGYRGDRSTDPYANLPVNMDFFYNFLATRRALKRNATVTEGLTDNDLKSAWRQLATASQFRGSTSPSYVFFDASRKVGVLSGANLAQEGTYKAQVAVADSGGYYARGGVATPTTTTSRLRFPTGVAALANGVCVVGVFAVDPTETGAIFYVGARAADASNDVRAVYTVQATPNVGINRNIATVQTAELAAVNTDTLIANTTNWVAVGLRLDGTSASVFVNGKKYGQVTLNAASQGLAGSGFVVGHSAGTRQGLMVLSAFPV